MCTKTLPIMMTVLVAVGFGLVFGAFAEDAEYVGQKQCKMCHNKKDEGAQWSKWSEMAHAGAYETLLGDKAKEIAKEKGVSGPPNEAAECLKCHVTGYTAEAPAKINVEDGVQCESCHGPASLHLPDGKAIKFAKDEKPDIDLSEHIVRPGADVCVKCHNEESPGFEGFDFEERAAKIAHPNPKKAE